METEKRNRARMTAILALLTVILAVAAAVIGFLAVKKQKYEKQLSLGEKYLAELDYENAEICFREAISIEEKEAAPYLQLAAVYFVQERTEEAKEILEEGSRSVKDKEGKKQLEKSLEEITETEDQKKEDLPEESGKPEQEKKNPEEKDPEEKDPAAAADQKQEEQATDGSSFVRYKDCWYFRRYDAADFESTAIFGNYQAVEGQPKDIVRMNDKGEMEILFQDQGAGDIFIVEDKMLLSSGTDLWNSTLYVTDFAGNRLQDLGKAQALASDRERGLAFYQILSGNLAVWSGKTGEIREIPGTSEGGFLRYQDGFFYYTIREGAEKVTLWEMNVDRMEARELSQFYRQGDAPGVGITDVQVTAEKLVVNTGIVAGSAGMFQGGKIYVMNRDGSDKVQIAGGDGDYGTCAEPFYAAEENDRTVVYYLEYQDNGESAARRMVVGEASESTDFEPWNRGTYFYDRDGGISIYADTSGKPRKLLTAEELSGELYAENLNKQDETSCMVTSVSFFQDQVFYTVESGSHDPSQDMGWRYAYRRESTKNWLKSGEVGEKQLVYEY